jgi:hypothetical protein
MDKENVVYVQNGVLFNHKEEQNCVVCREMEIITLSKVSQTEKDTESRIFKKHMRVEGGYLVIERVPAEGAGGTKEDNEEI